MSKKLNLESLTKKLRNVANTQDSIPMFSLWIIHHKVNYKQIVDTWLEILKSSTPKHRLTLLYLANDVIQSCKRKKAEVFKEYFAVILPEAISFLRDPSISSGVVRVLNVWTSRKMYDVDLIDQLHAALLTNRPPDTLRQKLLAEYKPASLIDAIAAFKKTEDALSIEEKQIKSINVDASSSDNIHKLKDKVGGERYSRNFEESATNIERFITQYQKFIEERKAIIDDLSQGAVFYRAQYHEAKIVVNAYQSFNTRVSKMKKMLDQVKLKFSPKTPPPMATNLDSNVADMDMSDSDQELGSKPSKIVAVDTNTNRPAKPQNPVSSATNKPTQQTGTFVNRPGMRGASTSSMFSAASPLKTQSANINIPISFNGGTTVSQGSKVSTPSGSPPSPEGSPELNISSPPRYPSLESRLADIFSTGSKPNLSSATENTGSESDNDSVPPKGEQSAVSAASDSAQESVIPHKDIPASSAPETQSSWQNTIPVIGGNRIETPNRGRSFMENLAALDGGSTPLQDEVASESEAYGNEKSSSNGVKPAEQVLPPPSFSGDALNFLTKFMGQQTNTSLPETTHTIPASQEQVKPINPLDSLNIDWNSIQSITASMGNRLQTSSGQAYDHTGSQNNAVSTLSQAMRERDTDYRTSVSFPPSSTVTTEQIVAKHDTDAADQFRDMLRRKSAEHLPAFAPSTEEVIVEEEEIIVEDEGQAEQQRSQQGHHLKYNKVHLNNLKNIPTAFSDNLSPPPAPPPNNLLQLAGQKRHMEDEDFRMRSDFPPQRFPRPRTEPRGNHFTGPMVQQHLPGMPGGHRPRFHGSLSARGPHLAEPFGLRPPAVRRNSAADFAVAENDYYDRLYDELRPKYPRPNMGRGQFRPRRPFR